MEDALACLASLSDRFAGFVIRNNIGVLIRQHINNSRIIESCLNIYYRLISPIAVGIKGKTYFFDERRKEKEYDTPEMHINHVMFRESTVFSDKNCIQVTMDLEKLTERYLPLLDPRERDYILTDIVNIILPALADFQCLKTVKSQLENKQQNSGKRCKKSMTDLLLKLYGLYQSKIKNSLIEVSKDLSTRLNAGIIINPNQRDTKGREYWQKAGEYESKIRKEAAKSLAELLREKLLPKYNDIELFNKIELYLTTTKWWSEE